MRIYIPRALKSQTAKRADHRCEYCLMPEILSYYSFHFEHIRPLKHGGKTTIDNLAFSCPDCNYFKGTDLGTYPGEEIEFVRFFNPRTDKWKEHFIFDEGQIIGISEIGIATQKIFKFNITERLDFRRELIALGLYF